MTEAANICQLATIVLGEHVCHPHYHRIGLSGIQGVEAVLTILQECYGWSYPGGLFLAAVDLLLEKEPVVRAVKQQLQRCMQPEDARQQPQQEELSTADSQAGSSAHASEAGSMPLQAEIVAAADAFHSSRETSTGSIHLQQQEPLQGESSSGEEGLVRHEPEEHQQQQWQHSASPAAPASEHDSPKAGASSNSGTSAPPGWQMRVSSVSADAQLSSRSTTRSPAGASSTASAPRSRSSTPATPPAARAGQLGGASSQRSAGSRSSRPHAAGASHLSGNPVASPISATSPVLQGAAARLALQQQHQAQRGAALDSFQRHQHQQLQHLLFDAPSEVITAGSLAGSTRHIDLSAVNSPHQIQAQHELQQELSRSSVSSSAALTKHSKQQWQQQQQMLPLPQKATEQQRLQETLQFARQPVQLPSSPVSTWQQWQQQQQLVVANAAAAMPGSSPWRLQQLQQQQQEQSAASPLAVPQPQHKQPPLSPPVMPPHTASPAVTPLPLPLQEQQQRSSPAASINQPLPQQSRAAGAEVSNAEGTAQQQQQQQQQPANQQQNQQQQQQPAWHRSPQQQQEQLQDLQELAGILQPVLFDDAAASEVLSEWLSGSDVAVADSEAGSDAATTGPAGFVFPPTYMVPLQPGSAASTAGAAIAASPPVAPHMLHFTPLTAGPPVGWQSREQAAAHSGDRMGAGGMGYASSSPAPGSAASAAGVSQGQQQAWLQQGTPSSVAAAQPHSTGRRTGGSSVAQGGTPRHVELSPGSSVTVQRATAAEGDDQSLVLDIDLAKVLDSSGTIVLQVCRDETGALTAAAALAPAATPAGTKRAAAAAAAAAAAGTIGLVGPQRAASPVIGSRGRQGQQGLPLGSISVDGSIGAAAWGPGQQRPTAFRQNLQRQHEEQPVHRVLRYSAEGCVSVDSNGPAVLGSSVDFATSQQQQQQEPVRLADVTRSRQLGDASWVLADIKPVAGSSPEAHGAADTANGSDAAAAVAYHQQQQQGEEQEGEPPPQQQQQLVEEVFVHEEAQQAVLAKEKDTKSPDMPVPGGFRLATPGGSTGGANDLRQQAQLSHAWQQAAAAAAGAGDPAHPHPHQQALLQGQGPGLRTPRTQRVSLEPPSTPLAGSVAGALLSAQHSDLAGAGQSSTYCAFDAGPLGAGEEGVTTFGDCAGAAASTTPAAAAAAATPSAAGAGTAAGTPATARGSGLQGAGQASGQSASPLPPELLSAETPAGFKFWAAGRGGGGLRYTAAQTLESLTNLEGTGHMENPTGAAAAAAGQYRLGSVTEQQEGGSGNIAAPGALAGTSGARGAGPQQQQQALLLSLQGQSLELLGLSEADLLGQLGLNQVSLDLLGVGDMQHLELQMMKAQEGAAGGQQSAHLPAARALAASAVKLLRQSLAVAAAAAACQRTPAAGKEQRLQQEGTCELPAAAAPAAAMALNNTMAYQSLELLPRQLLQSLQAAAAAAEAAAEGTGSQAQQALAAAAAAAGALGLDQQLQVQDSALPQLHVGVQDSLTNWLADRFGADVNLQKSVSLLLQELEQQQPQGQQQAAASRDALLDGDASEAAAAVPAAAMTATQQQRQHDQHYSVSGVAEHDGDVSELCATASPVPAAWHAALAQQQQHAPGEDDMHEQVSPDAVQQHQHTIHHHQQVQQQQQEQEQLVSPAAPASYACWSNRVEQLLRVSQVSPEGDTDSAAAAAATVLTEGSLCMTPSPSGYGPHPDVVGEGAGDSACADRIEGPGGACEGAGAGAGAGEFALVEVSSVPSLFRTSVMTNPLYLVEPSTGDLEGAVLLVAQAAADTGAAPGLARQEAAAAEALPSIPEGPLSAAAQQVSPPGCMGAAAAAEACLEEQDSREAAAILQQYLPYSSSSDSGSPCGTDNAGSSSTARRPPAAGADPHSADSEEPGHLLLPPAADLQPTLANAARSPSSPAAAAQPSAAAAQQASACSLDYAAVTGAADDCQSTGRSAGESQHPGSAHSSQPGLPVLFVADSGGVGVSSYSHSSSAAAHSRAGPAVPAQRAPGQAAGDGSNTSGSSRAGQGSSGRSAVSASSRQGQGISIGSCTGGQASPRTPRGELYGSFCAAAEGEPELAAGEASVDFGRSGSSPQQQQQQLYSGSAAAAESGSSAPRDWCQQPPRWQVVSQLEWADAHASQQGEEEVQDWDWHEQQALQQQGRQGQAESDSPAEDTEVASEPSWVVQRTTATQELQDDAQQLQQHQQHWEEEEEEEDSCGQDQQQEPQEYEQHQGLQLPEEPQSVSRIQRLMQQLRNRRKLQHAAASPAGRAPAPGECNSPTAHAGAAEQAAVAEPAARASPAGEGVQPAGSYTVVDTLCAAEAAMQQALQRVQLLQGQQQHEQQQEQAQLQEDISDVGMQQAMQQAHEMLQQEQQQQQQPAAASWQAWDRHMQHSEQLQLQQPAASPEQQPTGSAASATSEGQAAYEEQGQQDPFPVGDASQQLFPTSACAARAGVSCTAAAAAVAPVAAAAVAAAASAAAESPSVKWVREVLHGSSTFSSYVQALAHGDTNPSAHSKLLAEAQHKASMHGPAEEQAGQGGCGGGDLGAAVYAAGSDTGMGRHRGPEADRAGLREQVAGRMSALLAAVQTGDVRASCCSGSDISISSMGSGSVAAAEGRGGLSAAGMTAGGGSRQAPSMWQDRIQQLLAAADAAADSLTQPLSAPLPAGQQRRLAAASAAGASKPPASRAAATTATGGRAAGLGLSSRAAAHSRGAAAVAGGRAAARQRLGMGLAATHQQLRQGGRVQETRSTKEKPDKVAAAAAIVAARLALPAAAAARVPGAARAGDVRPGSTRAQKQLSQGYQTPSAEHSLQAVAADTAAAKDRNQAAGQQHQRQQQQALKQECQQQQLQPKRLLPQAQPHSRSPSEAVQDVCPSGGAAEQWHSSDKAGRRASLSLRGRPLSQQQQLQQEPAGTQQTAQAQPPPHQEEQHILSTHQNLPAAEQQHGEAAAHLPSKASGVAALAARQRERLQQLRLQQQPHQETGPALQQRPAIAVDISRDTPPAAGPAGSGSALTLNTASSSRGVQVRPEDSAGMLSPNAAFTGTTRPSKTKLQQHALLPVQGSSAVMLAAVGSSSGGGTGSATAAAAATAQAAGQQKSSMFDIRRPKGYTFSTAKARAAAELARAEQPAGQQEQLQPSSISASTQPAAQPSCEHAGKMAARPADAGAGAAIRDVSPAAVRQSVRKQTHVSAAAVVATPPVQASRQAGGLQAEDSFSGQRSHGLSLRKGSRQPSPTGAAPAHNRQQQMEPAGHSSFTVYSQQGATAAAGLTSTGRRQQLPAVAMRGRAAAGRGSASAKAGSTTAGAVAAVAAVKAALSGFGARGWQQQDVCSWLSKLRLDVLPEEPTAPLLSNPLRNGLLLAGVAASVTLQPLQGIRQPVTSLAAARCNLLMAAARLRLISVQFACTAAVAAAQHDKGEALRGLGLSQGGLHPAAALALSDSPVLRPGLALVGSPVRRQGRSSIGGSPAKGGSYCRSRSVSPNRSYVSNGGSSGGGAGSGVVLDSANTCRCLVVVATGPGLAGSCVFEQQGQQGGCCELASVLCSPASTCCCDCWACPQLQGSVLEHAVLQLLELTLAGDTSCMWGLLYALQQAYPVVPGSQQGPASPMRGAANGAARGTAKPRRSGSPQKQQARHEQQRQQQEELQQQTAAGAGSGRITVQPLQGPSWRSFKLPYTAAELDRLEHRLLQWLEELDIICAADTPNWSCLSTELSSGVLLAEVAAAVGLPQPVGVQERPVTAAARAGNMRAVLDVLQLLPSWPGRLLLQQHSAALTAGERPALTALLEALWVWTTGQQQGSWLRWLQP